jgi:hypothetical protein
MVALNRGLSLSAYVTKQLLAAPLDSTGSMRRSERTERAMTALEITEVILKFLTLIGLVGIAAAVLRKHLSGESNDLVDIALGFTAVAGALWIIVSMLRQ